jgi:hypothetical protein
MRADAPERQTLPYSARIVKNLQSSDARSSPACAAGSTGWYNRLGHCPLEEHDSYEQRAVAGAALELVAAHRRGDPERARLRRILAGRVWRASYYLCAVTDPYSR